MSKIQDFKALFGKYQDRIKSEVSPDFKPDIQAKRRQGIDAEYRQPLEAAARAVRSEISALQARRKQLSDPTWNLVRLTLLAKETRAANVMLPSPSHADVMQAIHDQMLSQVLPSMDVSALESMAAMCASRPALLLALRQELQGRPHEQYGEHPHEQKDGKARVMGSIDSHVKIDRRAVLDTLKEERDALRAIHEYEGATSRQYPARKIAYGYEDAALDKQIKAMEA